MKRLKLILPLLLFLASCASKKSAIGDAASTPGSQSATEQSAGIINKLTFMQKVADNRVYAKNIVGNMTFSIKTKSDIISAPGSVHMRENEIIRLQLFIPLLGSEIGRIEFTPDHVLIIDRMHKEYISADYNQVAFLKNNGINFHTLQALFWNRLFLPGEERVSESALKMFEVDIDTQGKTLPVTYNDGNMNYTWHATKADGLITRTDVAYNSATHGTSTLNWEYSNFRSIGVKLFPTSQSFTFATNATGKSREITITIRMSDVKDDSKWETTTKISPKYKQVSTDEIIKKLLSL